MFHIVRKLFCIFKLFIKFTFTTFTKILFTSKGLTDEDFFKHVSY